MTDLEHAKHMIAHCAAKRDAAPDPASRRYYELCLAGWRRWLAKLEREG